MRNISKTFAFAAAAMFVAAGIGYAGSTDGTYVFYSAKRLSANYRDLKNRPFDCPGAPAKPVTFVIKNNEVQCANGSCVGSGRTYTPINAADLSPAGTFQMSESASTVAPRFDGRLDGNGNLLVRLTSSKCSYDMVYRRRPAGSHS